MQLIKEIIQKRGNVIEIELDDDMIFYATEYKREQGFERWSIVSKVISRYSMQHALDRLYQANYLKYKNWKTFPDWI